MSDDGTGPLARDLLPAVAHMVWSGDVGGVERFVHELAQSQRAAGVAATIALGQDRGPFAASMRGGGVPVLDLGLSSGYDLRPGRTREGVRVLARFDLIHLHGFNLPLAALATATRRPIVFTDHGYFGKSGARGQILRLMRRVFLRRACTQLAANSAWTAHRLSSACGIDRSSIAVIHNGIAVGRAARTIQRRGDDSLIVAFVGRLAAVKRVDRVLSALSQAGSRERIRTLIVGSGPMENELRDLASRLGVQRRVEFLGTRPDIDSILAGTDVLVLPSQAESFGLAIVESCLNGALPIAFADGGGALEAMPPDGLVANNEADLASMLDELVGNRGPVSEQARRARARWVAERFPIDRAASSYLTVYRAALEGMG
jgi:glycosyltransferase involved in cell wall biosynthesis